MCCSKNIPYLHYVVYFPVFFLVMVIPIFNYLCSHTAFDESFFVKNKSCQFSFILASNWSSQLKWCKQLSIKHGEEALVGSAVARSWGFRWGVEWKNPSVCVYLGCRRAFWEDRGVGRLLWKIKDILSNILRATKYSVLGEKGQNRATKHKKAPQNKPTLHGRLLTQSNSRPLRDWLFLCDGQDPPFCLRDIQQIQLRENNGGRGSPWVPQKQYMYNKHSHRKSKKICSMDYSRNKVPETTLCLRSGKKVWFPPPLLFIPDH